MKTKLFLTICGLFLILSCPLYSQHLDKAVYSVEGLFNTFEFLEVIKEQTGYRIAYKQSDLRDEKKVKLYYKNKPLDVVLKDALAKYGLSFVIYGNQIIIKKETPLSKGGISGTVKNKSTLVPLEYANVLLLDVDNNQVKSTFTGSCGCFWFPNLKVGRYQVKASMIGFMPTLSDYLVVSSSGESRSDLFLNEGAEEMNEVTVVVTHSRNNTQNIMSLAGGRTLSIEEANRFAGNFDDPTRLASSFAGVTTGSVNSNAMEVRGNAPQFAQWRMEGVETPNLSHYADMSGLGGGILTGLSLYTTANSDFYYGTYPAEFSNSLSGIFDMRMRVGNTTEFDHSVQLGIWGMDVSSEGPINPKSGSSYLFNYRYSYSGLADKISGSKEGLDYQDLAFKVNLPTRHVGTFTLWGIGLLDKVVQEPEEDEGRWETYTDREKQQVNMQKGVFGVGHSISLKDDAYLKTNIGFSYSGTKVNNHIFDDKLDWVPAAFATKHETNVQLNSYINKRFNSWHTNRTGVSYTGIFYDMDFNISPSSGLFKPMERCAYGSGQSNVFYVHSSSLFRINRSIKLSAGIGMQYFDLNQSWSIEPRLNVKWDFSPEHYLSFGYGLFGRRERIEYYYTNIPMHTGIDNIHLKLAKTHKMNLTYDWMINRDLNLRIEPYFQYLYDLPVENNSSFSIVNFNAFILDRRLVSEGKGKNYGIDLSLEHGLEKGWYWMINGSIFKSKYMGGDKIWRSSRMDRLFAIKVLAGKEWILGKKDNKILGVNAKLTFQGGERYTPIDYIESGSTHQIEEDETKAYSLRLPPSFISDLTINYKINKKKVVHEISLQFLNLNGFKNTYYQYNMLTNQIEKKRSATLVPNLRYKLYF